MVLSTHVIRCAPGKSAIAPTAAKFGRRGYAPHGHQHALWHRRLSRIIRGTVTLA